MAYELKKDFIEQLVNQPITDYKVSSGANAADNVAGELKAVEVQTAPGDTLHLVHKTFPSDPMGKAFMAEGGGFRVEVQVYSELIPMIENLIKSRNPSNYKLPVPKYYAGFNNDSDDYLTLEDLRPDGFKMADKFKGLTFAETSLLLKELARFHAFTYFLIRQEGEKLFDNYPLIKMPNFFKPEKLPEFAMMIDGSVKYVQELVSANHPENGGKLSAKLAAINIPAVFGETMFRTDKVYFPVISHGDIWLNNALFKYDQNGNPSQVKFIDFQLTRRGNIFDDLKYFFFTSTTPEFRKEYLYEALDVYYNSFVQTLADIKFPVPIGFSRGFLFDHFDEARFGQYLFMGFALPMQLGDNPKMAMSDGAGPELPPGFNPMDLPAEIRIGGMVQGLRKQLETSPKALARLMDLTQEMADLKLI